MPWVYFIAIICVALLYEKVWRTRVCQKKIYEYIERLGGSVDSIERLTPREELYRVNYRRQENRTIMVVKFNIFYEMQFK
ncbi:MAG: hypothetical protein AB9856_08480 [Cellulosilyticaceae bacterium]